MSYDDNIIDADIIDDEETREAEAPKRKAKKSRIPDHAPQPRDRKPKSRAGARRDEAETDVVVLEQCGVEIVVPRHQGKWPLAATEKFAEGNEVLGMRELMGKDQWSELIGAGATNDDLTELAEQMSDELGLSGN